MPREMLLEASGIYVRIYRTLATEVLTIVDALNRFGDSHSIYHTIHMMKYIFPRQFGLHNVFTSSVDKQETVQPFKDYTLREHEILQHSQSATQPMCEPSTSDLATIRQHLPRRLRGAAVALVRKIQQLHSKCSYSQMMDYYCPPPVRFQLLLMFSC